MVFLKYNTTVWKNLIKFWFLFSKKEKYHAIAKIFHGIYQLGYIPTVLINVTFLQVYCEHTKVGKICMSSLLEKTILCTVQLIKLLNWHRFLMLIALNSSTVWFRLHYQSNQEHPLHKICENKSFHWLPFSSIKIES